MFAPDSHFYLPLCCDVAPHSSGPSSEVATISHFGHELTVAAPLLTTAALLALTVRVEAYQDTTPLPPPTLQLPADREVANALGYRGPTLEDVREFNYGVRTSFIDRCSSTLETLDSDSDSRWGSEQHDEDWNRVVACHDPRIGNTSLRGMVYTLGTLSGCWSGRVLVCQTASSTLSIFR